MLAALVTHFRDIRLVKTKPRFKDNVVLRGLRSLTLEVER